MWCNGPTPPTLLPARLAAPWCALAATLGMPPVLTYATYNLYNWRRLDASKPVQLGNIVCLANFLAGHPPLLCNTSAAQLLSTGAGAPTRHTSLVA